MSHAAAASAVHPRVRGEQSRSLEQRGFGSVHPRVRGEQASSSCSALPHVGSSPRARGTARASEMCTPPRFIPACAGNGRLTRSAIGAATVHPRVRGERLLCQDDAVTCHRFIPACAGNGPGRGFADRHDRFIPACAGNGLRLQSDDFCRVGSSPRARGTAAVIAFAEASSGSSPRARGTAASFQNRSVHVPGSSPRARGTDDRDGFQQRQCRFIPACAGNGRARWRECAARTVHPRVRGERPFDTSLPSLSRGSSPRARGTALTIGQDSARRSVHPRVRGERSSTTAQSAGAYGSSPRARGTACTPACCPRRRRFIPACAGNGNSR